jgi:hypothetical protein
MKKLIEELEAQYQKCLKNGGDDYLLGLDAAMDIVLAHNPWTSVETLPDEHEKVLVRYGDDSVLIGIIDSDNKWSVFWSDGLRGQDTDRPITHWAFLPEVKP